MDDFEFDDVGYDTHEPTTIYDNQTVVEKKITSTENNVNNATSMTTTVPDKSLFSSPQNRRTSMSRQAQPSLSLDTVVAGGDHRVNSVVESDVNGGQNEGFSPSDEAKAASSEAVGVPVDAAVAGGSPAVVAAVGIAADVGKASPDILRHTESTSHGNKNAPKEARTSTDRIQAVVGALPILIVDDSVSILKMTKSVIQNECTNIRSTHSINTTLSYIHNPLTHPPHTPYQCIHLHTLSQTLSTRRCQLYRGQER